MLGLVGTAGADDGPGVLPTAENQIAVLYPLQDHRGGKFYARVMYSADIGGTHFL